LKSFGDLWRLPPGKSACKLSGMGSAELARIALELPPEERLDLARRLVESVVAPASLNEAIAEGIRRIEDLATGRVKGLTEEEFLATLK
jgi:putative addiction module component (TIGR02574 family)